MLGDYLGLHGEDPSRRSDGSIRRDARWGYSVVVTGPEASVLIGRHAELAVLDELIAQASAGVGGIVLLSGDPGVGKTRLAREASERAAGAVVSWGACRESEGAPPLWPWTQVLRRLAGTALTVEA